LHADVDATSNAVAMVQMRLMSDPSRYLLSPTVNTNERVSGRLK
jgi:hypothetical protein